GELTDEEFFEEYQSYDTIKSQFKKWAKRYEKYATYHKSIGKSIEGRDIFTFDITDKTYTGEKKEIVYIGGIHAREWISPASVSYISYRLLTDAQSDEQIAEHLKKFIFRIIPLANPDGYEYSRTGDRMWRKNRRDNGDGTFGVDLNRNFPEHWAFAGSTDDTDDETYHGSGPGSEPEVAAIMKYIDSLENPYGAIDWHSYGQKILKNPGWTTTPSENDDILTEIADEMINTFDEFGFKFTQQLSSELYPASGTSDDWLAQDQGLVSFTVELCPTEPEEAIGFELPESSLVKCATAAYYSSTTFAQYLLDFPDIPPNKMFS
ncbi:peptidase M14, carboxypeptidase A, partial [Conidiobolus coronatus NRRL 28638]